MNVNINSKYVYTYLGYIYICIYRVYRNLLFTAQGTHKNQTAKDNAAYA